MNEYRRHLTAEIPPIVTEFFATFSRFEFALNRGGFLMGEIGRKAEPDWDTFARTLGADFFEKMRASEGAKIFFEAQPKSLKVAAAQAVEFNTPDPIVNAQMLFVAVRLVRSNLFHGEKPHVTERDQELMTAALFVLDSAMEACEGIERCQDVPRQFQYSPPIQEN